MSYMLKTIYKAWNYVVTFSTPVFGMYAVYDIQQIVFNKERQARYSRKIPESRHSKPIDIGPTVVSSNITNPTSEKNGNVELSQDVSKSREQKNQPMSNSPTPSKIENESTKKQEENYSAKQPMTDGKVIIEDPIDISNRHGDEMQNKPIIPTTSEGEYEPMHKQKVNRESKTHLFERKPSTTINTEGNSGQVKYSVKQPEYFNIPTTLEREHGPIQKQEEQSLFKQSLSKLELIIQQLEKGYVNYSTKYETDNGHELSIICNPCPAYIDASGSNSSASVIVCQGLKKRNSLKKKNIIRHLRNILAEDIHKRITDRLSMIDEAMCNLMLQFIEAKFRAVEDRLAQSVIAYKGTKWIRVLLFGVRVDDDQRQSVQAMGFRECKYIEPWRAHIMSAAILITYEDPCQSLMVPEFDFKVYRYLSHLVKASIVRDLNDLLALNVQLKKVGVNVDLRETILILGVRIIDINLRETILILGVRTTDKDPEKLIEQLKETRTKFDSTILIQGVRIIDTDPQQLILMLEVRIKDKELCNLIQEMEKYVLRGSISTTAKALQTGKIVNITIPVDELEKEFTKKHKICTKSRAFIQTYAVEVIG